MGLPAARLTDLLVCPLLIGGPISVLGSPVTLIGMLPAARIGDMVAPTTLGPPDPIVLMGSNTILIGGQPAARMTSQCVHGGMVTTGCFTVLLGG